MGRVIRAGFFLCVVLALFGALFQYGYKNLLKVPSHQSVRLTIDRGESVKSISKKLHTSGVITHPTLFQTYLYLRGYAGSLKAGTYDFDFPVNELQLADILVKGMSNERSVRIIEGWTVKDIERYLENARLFTPSEFQQAMRSIDRREYPFLSREAALEGYLFPDTYRIFTDERRVELVEKMLREFGEKFKPIAAKAQERGQSVHDVVTMASILEREVKDSKDQQLVADILYRRLSVDMPLQVDSSVNYITGKNSPQASGTDIVIDSPFNTYKYRGLPPGPICNPGLSALTAAVHPTPNRYWYFLTTKEGEVVYSMTYEEHLKNKRKYLD